jgi:hypothetical protein
MLRFANGKEEVLTTASEQALREQNGDPRFLNIAARVAEREDRYWMREDDQTGRRRPTPIRQ